MADPQSKFYLILPAYNEEKNITTVLHTYTTAFTHPDCRFHVVVNNSSDATAKQVATLAESDKRIVLTDEQAAIGKGGAVYLGFRAALSTNHAYIGFIDSDGSVDVAAFQTVLAALVNDDAVSGAIGSRWIKGAHLALKQPWPRRVLSRFFNVLVRVLFQFSYYDTQCGLKIFRREALQRMMPKLWESSFVFDIELLWVAKKLGLKILEVPIVWRDSDQSSVRPVRVSLVLLRALLRIRFAN